MDATSEHFIFESTKKTITKTTTTTTTTTTTKQTDIVSLNTLFIAYKRGMIPNYLEFVYISDNFMLS
jgi:hypothetical protein